MKEIKYIEKEPLLAWLEHMSVREYIIKTIADENRFPTISILKTYADDLKEIRSEAIKEFADRLKNVWFDNRFDSPDIDFDYFVDELVKEMVGAEE